MGGSKIDKIKKLWNGVILFSIFTSLLVLLAQVLIFVLILSVNMSLAFTLFSIFFIIDAFVLISFTKKNIESDIMNISFFVLVLSSPLVYGLIYYLKTFYLPANPQVVHIGSIDSWIGFAGSILSGLLVMISLVYTIKHERLIRDEDKKNELLPFLDVSIECYDTNGNLQHNIFRMDGKWILIIKNISSNAARNIKVVELIAEFYSHETENNSEKVKINAKTEKSLSTSLIVQNQTHDIYIHINTSDLPSTHYSRLKIASKIEYYDLTLKNKHSHSSTLFFENKQIKRNFEENGYILWNIVSISNDFID